MKWVMYLMAFCGAFILACAINDIVLSDVQPEETHTEVINDLMDNSQELFVPTEEWKIVKDGQAIPAGLHVRMNFQTGVKEAKLMEDVDKESSTEKPKGPRIVTGEQIGSFDKDIENSKEKLHFTKAHLKEALKDFRDKVGTKDIVDDITWSDDAKEALKETSEEDKERVKKKFRSMEEIRADLEDKMGWSMKSDVESMKEYIEYLTDDKNSVDQKSIALDNLEDYVHQIDNARDLNKIGGMEVIVNLLNSTNKVLPVKAANVIGAATQNNRQVQDDVLSYNGLRFLLRMIDNESTSFKKKALFALSALIRGNYAAQIEFQKLNGIEKVMQILRNGKSDATKLKAIMLINDLIVEQNDIPDDDNSTERPDWSKSLLQGNWCNVLKPLLDTTDYDTKEKVLQALDTSLDLCLNVFHNNNISQKLSKQVKVLRHDIENETDSDFKSYLESLLTQVKNIMSRVDS